MDIHNEWVAPADSELLRPVCVEMHALSGWCQVDVVTDNDEMDRYFGFIDRMRSMMILKTLREQKHLSQEQLATMSGLSIRTIQRIESGSRASLESLKALAAVLETTVSALEQDIVVIDKTSAQWKELPLLFRLNFIGSDIGWLGLSERKHWVRGEKQTALFGLVLMPFGFVDHGLVVGGLLMVIMAYGLSLVTRTGDKYSIW